MPDLGSTTSHRVRRIARGHYLCVPSGYLIVQYVRREGAWRVLDGGGRVVFHGDSFKSAKEWVANHA